MFRSSRSVSQQVSSDKQDSVPQTSPSSHSRGERLIQMVDDDGDAPLSRYEENIAFISTSREDKPATTHSTTFAVEPAVPAAGAASQSRVEHTRHQDAFVFSLHSLCSDYGCSYLSVIETAPRATSRIHS